MMKGLERGKEEEMGRKWGQDEKIIRRRWEEGDEKREMRKRLGGYETNWLSKLILEMFCHSPFNYEYLPKTFQYWTDRYFGQKLWSVLVIMNPVPFFQGLLKINPLTSITIIQIQFGTQDSYADLEQTFCKPGDALHCCN